MTPVMRQSTAFPNGIATRRRSARRGRTQQPEIEEATPDGVDPTKWAISQAGHNHGTAVIACETSVARPHNKCVRVVVA
jgi:hypothetical protein